MPSPNIEQFISDSLNRATRLTPLHRVIRRQPTASARKAVIMAARQGAAITGDEATMLISVYLLETA